MSVYHKDLPEDHVERLNEVVGGYEKQILARLNDDYTRGLRRSDRVADKIATFGGSWVFIALYAGFLVAWMLWNVLSLTHGAHFDQPPFILLNLILSFTAAFQAPIILMSQNRQTVRDKRESVIDFAINWSAEREIEDIQAHLHRTEASLNLLIKMAHEMKAELETFKEAPEGRA